MNGRRKMLVVVLNYRLPGQVVECLRALAPQMAAFPDARVVVTDNDSRDGSVARIRAAIAREGWGDWASVEPLPVNGGYAYGNNAAIRADLASRDPSDYVLVLNPDTVPRAGALEALVAHLEAHPAVGMAGSRLEDDDGTPQDSAFRFPSVPSELISAARLGVVSRLLSRWAVVPEERRDDTHLTDWVAGAAVMIRRQVFEDIGLFDEGFFLYFEEVDFCRRARQAGWEIAYVPASRVVHHMGASTGVSDERKTLGRRPAYWFESRRRYFLKHHGPTGLALADVATLAGYASFRVRRRLQQKPDRDPPRLLWDYFRHSVLVKGALR